MKKTIAVALLCIILCPLLTCIAAPKAEVYIENTSAKSGSVIFVPLYIKNNPGLMGFRITVRYDAEVLSPRAAARGTVTESGLFEDSAASSEDASVDVLWNNTKEIKKDGTLAILGFDCSAAAAEKTELKISFTQADTFNEQYEDVVLTCKGAVIDFGAEVQMKAPKDKREVTSEDVVLAVETVQGDPKIPPTKAVMESVNSLLSQLTGDLEPYFDTPDAIQGSYKAAVQETFIQDALDAVEAVKVLEIVQNALDRTGAPSIETIPEEMRIDFINEVEAGLREEAPDLKELSDFVSQEDEMPVIAQLFAAAGKELEKSDSAIAEISASVSKHPTVWIVCIAGGVLLCILIAMLLYKKIKNKSKTRAKKEGGC